MPAAEITEDALFDGRLRLRQPRRGHRAGSDAVLLAAAAPIAPGARLADFGAGVGTAALAVLLRVSDTRATLVEIEPDAAALARENIVLNDLSGRAEVILGDVAHLGRGSAVAPFDHIIANPPFHPASGRHPPDAATARARIAPPGLLDEWMRAAARLLAPDGGLTLIHRPDALAEILEALAGRFGALALVPVHPRADEPAVRLIVNAKRGSRAPLRIGPPLVLAEADGRFTPRAAAIHRDLAAL